MKNLPILLLIVLVAACSRNAPTSEEKQPIEESPKALPRVILDTDANNELDDQHAMAYLLFNSDDFEIAGVTVNATSSGGNIDFQYDEAERIMQLCKADKIPLLKGANDSFQEIRGELSEAYYDGKPAVDFIINEARKVNSNKLVVIAVGKLTNIALALEAAPDIAEKIRLVWLGSNYPAPGEHNLVNDIPAMNYIFETPVAFEMVMVRYAEPSGSDAVRVTPEDIISNLTGKGPVVPPVTGRHGGEFTTFGDYSVNLFENADLYGEPPSRALFDLVAVAVVKNPAWGEHSIIPAPVMVDEQWIDQPENMREVTIWENFDSDAILEDFYHTLRSPEFPGI